MQSFPAQTTEVASSEIKQVLILGARRPDRARLSGPARSAFPNADIATGDLLQIEPLMVAHRPDVILVDVAPGDLGMAHLRRVSRKIVTTNRAPMPALVAVLADCSDPVIVEAFGYGAAGVVCRKDAETQMTAALIQIAYGGVALSPAIAERIVTHFRRTGPLLSSGTDLTARETDVLRLIGQGLRVADAAAALELAPSTVACHIKSIYRKLGINCRAEAAFQAARLGLLG